MFKAKDLHKQAKKFCKSIVFPEASFSCRTLQAVKIIADKGIAKPILIGDESAIILADKKLAKFKIINPKTFAKTEALALSLYKKRKDKGMTLDEAKNLILDPYYFSTMLVEEGYADGMIGGAECATATNIKPALQIIKGVKNNPVSSCFLMLGGKFLDKKILLIGDCAVLQNPDSDQLALVAEQTLSTYLKLGLDRLQKPKIAFLSYSTKGSANADEVDKVKKACEKFKKRVKDLPVCVDGELQLDSALVQAVAKQKCPESEIAGDANILIFPNLESGNICVKAMQYFGQTKAVGPILQGLKKPVNDLSRGACVEDIVDLTAITVIQAASNDTKLKNQEEN